MTLFEPFPAYRFDTDRAGTDLARLLAPPYDVLSDDDVTALVEQDPHNIVRIDVPGPADDPQRYVRAAELYRSWIAEGVLVADPRPSFTIYRMSFRDASGSDRRITGVVGGLAVDAAARVLPHERVTPKASTDRLDLTRATRANLSPVWGLSLARGLTSALEEPGEFLGEVTFDGVEHRFERVDDPTRVSTIASIIGSDDVLIADGHHRYGISRRYHEEVADRPSSHTLAFVNELIAEQLSVEAIHRIYPSISPAELRRRLETSFEIEPTETGDDRVVAEMDRLGVLCLLDPGGRRFWLRPRPGAFEGVRRLDGAWLETCLDGVEVTYQHGVPEVVALVDRGEVGGAVLIRPVDITEIERTAREGDLMPPKSTFFTPKLRTGAMIRPLD